MAPTTNVTTKMKKFVTWKGESRRTPDFKALVSSLELHAWGAGYLLRPDQLNALTTTRESPPLPPERARHYAREFFCHGIMRGNARMPIASGARIAGLHRMVRNRIVS